MNASAADEGHAELPGKASGEFALAVIPALANDLRCGDGAARYRGTDDADGRARDSAAATGRGPACTGAAAPAPARGTACRACSACGLAAVSTLVWVIVAVSAWSLRGPWR